MYRSLLPSIHPIKYGIDPVQQLTSRFSLRLTSLSHMEVALFTCPLYEINNSRLEAEGFSSAINKVTANSLENCPRYMDKIQRSLKLALKIQELLPGEISPRFTIIFGDKGVINAHLQAKRYLSETFLQNQQEYQAFIRKKYPSIYSAATFTTISEIIRSVGLGVDGLGESQSDLITDGQLFFNKTYEFKRNPRVQNIIDGQMHQAKNNSMLETYGFVLNYGLAGLALRSRNTDIIIGSDGPTSYLNYLYHSFMSPEELTVLVPKEPIYENE